MRATLTAALICAVALTGCSGEGKASTSSAASDERATTTTEPEAITSAPALTEDEALEAALEVDVTTYKLENRRWATLNWTITNTSDQAITAHQIYFDFTVEDPLGRTATVSVVSDCLNTPIAAGQTIDIFVPESGSPEAVADPTIRDRAAESCVFGAWPLSYNGDADARTLLDAYEAGTEPIIISTVNSVVFEDGTTLGTPS